MRIERYGKTRYRAVLDANGTLVCLCVYKRGALEVLQRLQAQQKEERITCDQARSTMKLLAIHPLEERKTL